MIATLDTLTSEKHDKYAKGIRDQMLLPMSILMLLLLVEVLVPSNKFLSFFSNKKFELQLDSFKVSELHKIKENLPNYDTVDVSLRYFQLPSDLFKFSEITSSKVGSLRSRVEHHLLNDSCISKFIAQVRGPLKTNLIVEIEDAMKEISPVLFSFDLFNTEALDKSKEKGSFENAMWSLWHLS